jgi:sulfur carrier protein
MSIEVNQKNVEWVKNETVEQLLKRMKYTFPLVVVKINEKVIPKKDFPTTIIPDNSKIVVLHMISGG